MDEKYIGFFRGKVVDNVDPSMEGLLHIEIPKLNNECCIAAPVSKFSKAIDNESKYSVHAGDFDIPEVDDYIAVFFTDDKMCHYIPNWTLKYPGQTPKGMELQEETKLNFLDKIKRLRVKFREFFNGNIVGCDLNDETNSFFINFDNGVRLEFNSPNEEAKCTGTKSSHSRYPSLFALLMERKDSLYKGAFSAIADKTKALNIFSVENKQAIGNAFPGKYNSTDTAKNGLHKSTIKQEVSANGVSFINSNETTHSSANATLSTNSISVTSTTSADKKDKINVVNSTAKSNAALSNDQSINIGCEITDVKISKTKFSNGLEVEQIVNNNKTNDGLLSDDIVKTNSVDTSVSRTVSETIKDAINKVFAFSVTNKKKSGSYKKIENVKDSSVTLETTITTNNDKKTAKNIFTRMVDGSKIITSNTSNDGSDKKYDNVSILTEVDVANKTSKIELSTQFVKGNPIDPAKGALEMKPDVLRGQKLTMMSSASESSFKIESIKKAFIPMKGKMSEFGVPNSIEFKETDKEATLKIKMSNDTPATSLIEISIDTSDGSLKIKTAGNVSIDTGKGDISLTTTNLTVKAAKDIKIETPTEVNVKAKSIKAESTTCSIKAKETNLESDKVNIKCKSAKIDSTGDVSVKSSKSIVIDSASIDIKGKKVTTKGSVAPTGSGPYCAIKLCPFTGLPHVGDSVIG